MKTNILLHKQPITHYFITLEIFKICNTSMKNFVDNNYCLNISSLYFAIYTVRGLNNIDGLFLILFEGLRILHNMTSVVSFLFSLICSMRRF